MATATTRPAIPDVKSGVSSDVNGGVDQQAGAWRQAAPVAPVMHGDGVAQKRELVIVGNGMAGGRLVDEVLRRGGLAQWRVTVVGEEAAGSYNRILLPELLGGSQAFAPEDVAGPGALAPPVFFNTAARLAQAGVGFIAQAATAIDRDRKRVRLISGAELAYDALVLATGSRAFVPPIPGIKKASGALLDGVVAFRTLDDCAVIQSKAGHARRAVVVGGGLLGLEAARALLKLELEVTVLHPAGHLMERQLDADAAALIAGQLEQLGVTVRLAQGAARIIAAPSHRGESSELTAGSRSTTPPASTPPPSVGGVELDNGEVLAADLVVLAAGVRPAVELARTASLAVQRGIIVDDQLRCEGNEHGDIFSLGDCIEHRGTVYGLVAPAWEQAAVLADILLGDRTRRYTGSRVATKLKVAGIELAVAGESAQEAPACPLASDFEHVSYSEPRRGIYKKLVIRNGKVTGAIVLGDPSTATRLVQWFDRDAPLPAERAALLFDASRFPIDADQGDEALVCHCNGVTHAAVRGCVRDGAASVQEIMGATRAGTGCGSCRSALARFVPAGEASSADLRAGQGAPVPACVG